MQLYDSDWQRSCWRHRHRRERPLPFGGLPAGTYVVRVDTDHPAGRGVTNTVDPDGGTANQSTVTWRPDAVNLAQDFGYRDTDQPQHHRRHALEGPQRGRHAGRRRDRALRRRDGGAADSNGNVVATTDTDANGNYSFTNLPDGTYTRGRDRRRQRAQRLLEVQRRRAPAATTTARPTRTR